MTVPTWSLGFVLVGGLGSVRILLGSSRLPSNLWREGTAERKDSGAVPGTRVYKGRRTLAGKAELRAPSVVPQFTAGAAAAATSEPHLDDSCPDDIWQSVIRGPVPTLPYRVQHDYDRGGAQGRPGSLETVVLENGRFRVTIYPTLGGKVASVFDKVEQRDLVFDNPVFQPAALARLGAWTSGGIEWNWPRHGHSVFTARPVYVAEVDTEKGPLVRIFEFDREMNSTWQIDLFLPDSNAGLFIHGKVVNTNPWDIDAYWWTNIALKLDRDSRVLFPADFAIVDKGPKGMYKAPFPMMSDNGASGISVVGGAIHGHEQDFTTDHSYPSNYYSARETFLRSTHGSPRQWMGLANTTDGTAVLHAQTLELDGRKYWTWGNDPGDINSMNFLSSCKPGADTRRPSTTECNGWYMEAQAGVAPTQSQTFSLRAKSSLEWTEALVPSRLDVGKVQSPKYPEALGAGEEFLDNVLPTQTFLDIDGWLRLQSERPVSRTLAHGTAFGALHEELTGVKLSSTGALRFDSPVTIEELPWFELLENGTFSESSLAELAPQSFMVDQAWVRKLLHSRNLTYLHHLHLYIALRELGKISEAQEHLKMSLISNNKTNVLGLLLAGREEEAWASVLDRFAGRSPLQLDVHSTDVARDTFAAVLHKRQVARDTRGMASALASLEQLPPDVASRLRGAQPSRVAMVWLAVNSDPPKPEDAIRLLGDGLWAASDKSLIDVWYEAHYIAEASRMQRELTYLDRVHVRRANPPPPGVDFRGAT